MEANMIMSQGTQKMAAKAFASHFNSKKELYNFLSVEVGAYLCSHEVLTV